MRKRRHLRALALLLAAGAAAAAAPPPPPPPPPPLDRTLTVGGARFLSTAPYIDSGAPLFGAGLLDNALSLVSTSAGRCREKGRGGCSRRQGSAWSAQPPVLRRRCRAQCCKRGPGQGCASDGTSPACTCTHPAALAHRRDCCCVPAARWRHMVAVRAPGNCRHAGHMVSPILACWWWGGEQGHRAELTQ